MQKKIVIIICLIFQIMFLFAQNLRNPRNERLYPEFPYQRNKPLPPRELGDLKKAYPDLIFDIAYNSKYEDWEIKVSHAGKKKTKVFYWNKGSLIPESELPNKDKYRTILYKYDKKIFDPALMTEEQKKQLKEYTTAENRKSDAGSAMFFFDFIYDGYSQRVIEEHIVKTTFLGKRTKVHERVLPHVKKVEERIYEESKTDEEIKKFLSNIKSTDAYHWRQIAGTNRKSFHSLGIAIDILPNKYRGEMFWSWSQDKDPENWMLTPLSRRWMPPQKVIDIFEEEGFVWGGKWAIWDNMHFEYHPELLVHYNYSK